MDIISIKFPGGDFGCQNTSRSEYIASNALQNRCLSSAMISSTMPSTAPIVCAKEKKGKKTKRKRTEKVVPKALLTCIFFICRTDEESNFVNPDVGCSPEMPVLSLLCNQHVHPQQPSTADSLEAVPSALPPSFTDLLTGIDTEKGAICKLQIYI